MNIIEDKNKVKIRCAIYTRKSHEEGLEQSFNSLDAQRLAGESYIASQAHEGWECLPTLYDDGGYSGGNMERPALQKLFQDIKDGKIDCIVVYKIDRLTRSLLDFSKIIELLDEHKCSFVAVTQSFNTSNSMGRLMLNVLLSFAQYERELTSERIRDKFEASSKLGIWMGGVPPLGYDPINRELVINKSEAKIIEEIYKTFIETNSVTETVRIINELGYRTKTWISEKGKKYQGVAFSKKAIRHILQNPTYAGKINHKGKIYQGKHKAIIKEDVWQRVQSIFTSKDEHLSAVSTRISSPPLLKGIFYCGCCNARMTPSYSMKKNGTRYRYYTCSSRTRLTSEKCEIKTISAAEVEGLVANQILQVLDRPETVANVIATNAIDNIETTETTEEKLQEIDIIKALKDTSRIWDELFPIEQHRIIHLLIKKVTITTQGLKVSLFNEGLYSLTEELTIEGEQNIKHTTTKDVA